MLPKELTGDVFDNLKWETVDGEELDKIIEGMTVIGSEPIDYPATNGILSYLKDNNNTIYAVEIGYENSIDEDGNPFYVSMAKIEPDDTTML